MYVTNSKPVNLRYVAIIILNWNGWKDTIECLESVYRKDYPNYQVIVVDNGSTDGSVEKIKEWAEGKLEVLTPDPSHPLHHISHPLVQKSLFLLIFTTKRWCKMFHKYDVNWVFR